MLKQLDDEATGKRAVPGGMSIVGTDGFKGFTDETAILEQAKTVVLDTITPFDQFTQHIEYLKGVINDPPNLEVYKMAREELARTEEAFKAFKGEKKQLSGNEEAKQVASQMSQVTNGISSMVSGMQQLGVDIPEGMAEMIAAIQAMSGILTAILTITTLIEGKQTISTIASLIPGMAHGGVVHAANGWSGVIPGNTYSGDQIPIMANAGETVLTAAQTNNLASSLQSGGGGDMKIVGVLTGENVVLMADRWGKRTGKGELMFGKNI